MLDLVGNPEGRFSGNNAQLMDALFSQFSMKQYAVGGSLHSMVTLISCNHNMFTWRTNENNP